MNSQSCPSVDIFRKYSKHSNFMNVEELKQLRIEDEDGEYKIQ